MLACIEKLCAPNMETRNWYCQRVYVYLPTKILKHSPLLCSLFKNFKDKTSHLPLSPSATYPLNNRFSGPSDSPVLLFLECTPLKEKKKKKRTITNKDNQPTSKAFQEVTSFFLFNSTFTKPPERQLSVYVRKQTKTLVFCF